MASALDPGAARDSVVGGDGPDMKIALGLAAAALLAGVALQGADRVEFNRDVRPILSENCFACHGPDANARQAGLRLDRRDDALARGVIQPGDAAASRLVQRVTHSNPLLVMPPRTTDKVLTGSQKQTLSAWVEQGAEYQEHWAYLKPRRPDAPAGPAAIDFLVGRQLAASGLQPVAAADRRTLARRLSFDLTGLPPDPAVVEAFARDSHPDSYERLLGTLLDSPHYGERMAVHWLDLVRYADTVGYHGDVPVNIYPFRDYVVRAFNENKPFDAMTREQLAGDLFAEPTPWQLVASGYNRLSRMTNEGGAQAAEYLAKYATDRVRNVSTVWLGSTLGCAECHDHKFDPFLARDFYSMAAFFADIEEQGVFSGNAKWGASVRVLAPRDSDPAAAIDRKVAELRERGQGKLPARPDSLEDLSAYLRDDLVRWRVLEADRVWGDCEHPDFNQCGRLRVAAGTRRACARRRSPARRSHARRSIAWRQSSGTVSSTHWPWNSSPPPTSIRSTSANSRCACWAARTGPCALALPTLLPDREEPGSMLRDTLDEQLSDRLARQVGGRRAAGRGIWS